MVLSPGTIFLLAASLLVYINDLPNCLLNSVPRMYADDTHLTFASNNILNINTVLNEDLARVEKWLIANKLTLNASKTEVMLIAQPFITYC